MRFEYFDEIRKCRLLVNLKILDEKIISQEFMEFCSYLTFNLIEDKQEGFCENNDNGYDGIPFKAYCAIAEALNEFISNDIKPIVDKLVPKTKEKK